MAGAARNQQRTNFVVACSLLRQYIKEKGSAASLGLGIVQDAAAKGIPESFRPLTTMSLLPGVDASGREDCERETHGKLFSKENVVPECTSETQKSQLTIFYGGKVFVFDNFPADKAKDLMQLASKGSSTAQSSVCQPPSSTNADVASSTLQPSSSYLPITRKASLQRFIQKRKERINAKAPYPVVAPVKQDDSESGLGLAPNFSIPNLSLSSEYNR